MAVDKVEEDGSIIDDYRISYLEEHIKAMMDAVDEDGVDFYIRIYSLGMPLIWSAHQRER